MTGERPNPEIDSRVRRLAVYLQYNGSKIAVDVMILLAWILGAATVFDWFGIPRWLYYGVVFAGIIAYSRITPTWERPYRSPD